MKINRKMLPIKGFYFFFNAAAAPIIPSAPIMAKNIGYSMTGIGTILTIIPLLALISKPICGSLADKFSLHKVIFISLLLVGATSIFSLQWFVYPPIDRTVLVRCLDGDLQVVIKRSSKLWDKTFRDSILSSMNNTVFQCELTPYKETPMPAHPLPYKEPVNVELKFLLYEPPHTIVMSASMPTIITADKCPTPSMEIDPASLWCQDVIIQRLVDVPVVESGYGLNLAQFCFALCLITIRVANSCTFTFCDTICLMKLGDRPQDFGLNRSFEAFGWGGFALFGGFLIDWYSQGKVGIDYTLAFYGGFICNSCALLIGLSMRFEKAEKKAELLADVKKAIMGDHQYILFLFGCIFCGAFSGFVWSYLIWYVEDISMADPTANLSLIKTLEGLILFVHTCIGEIGFFIISGWMVKRFGHANCMSLVLFAFGLRFLLISYVPNPWWLLSVEVLNGVTYATYVITAVSYANVVAPAGTKATIQAITAATFDIGTCFGIFLGGLGLDSLSGRFCFRAAGLCSLCLGVLYTGMSALISKGSASKENCTAKPS